MADADDLEQVLKPRVRLKVAASFFSMSAFEALKAEMEPVDELHLLFKLPGLPDPGPGQ